MLAHAYSTGSEPVQPTPSAARIQACYTGPRHGFNKATMLLVKNELHTGMLVAACHSAHCLLEPRLDTMAGIGHVEAEAPTVRLGKPPLPPPTTVWMLQWRARRVIARRRAHWRVTRRVWLIGSKRKVSGIPCCRSSSLNCRTASPRATLRRGSA